MCSCTGINIGESFFKILGEQYHIFGYLSRLDSGHILLILFCVQRKVVPGNYYYLSVHILIRREG